MEREKQTEEKLFVRLEFDIERAGRIWKMSVADIADGRGITTELDDRVVYLDWHNILDAPDIARMHLYPGREKRVSYDEKLKRMETWASAIDLYESIMQDQMEHISKSEVEKMLAERNLPRPKIVVLDTGTVGLRRLFKELSFDEGKEKPHPFAAPWERVVELARTGELVEAWRKLKGK